MWIWLLMCRYSSSVQQLFSPLMNSVMWLRMSENPLWDTLRGWIFSTSYGVIFSHASPPSKTPERPRAAVTHLRGDLWPYAVRPQATVLEFNQHAETLFIQTCKMLIWHKLWIWLVFSPLLLYSKCLHQAVIWFEHKHTVLLLLHKFNESDTSDLRKQWNGPLWTLFQHQQGGWSVHISPLHVSLRQQCVWQMKTQICTKIHPEGWRSFMWGYNYFICSVQTPFQIVMNSQKHKRAQQRVVCVLKTFTRGI